LLKDKLDEKDRLYKLNQSASTPKKEEEEKIKKEQINEKALKDAQYLWKRLKKLFLTTQNNDELLSIDVCFGKSAHSKKHLHSTLTHSPNRVFVSCNSIKCDFLSRRKIKYIKETSDFLQQIAKDDGITLGHSEFSSRFLFDIVYVYQIYGTWISFTYHSSCVSTINMLQISN